MKFFNTKKITLSAVACITLFISSCKEDDKVDPVLITEEYTATINLTQFVNDSVLQMNTTDFPYTNGMMQDYKVTKLQYLISNVTFTRNDGSKVTANGYHYVDPTNPASLTYTLATKIPAGSYSSVGFTFGFDEADNIDGNYTDLNTVGWNWPAMLGGGYHFMRLEGDYINNTDTAEYKSHMGTARDMTTTPPTFEANHFEVTLANSEINVVSDFDFDIEMNIEEWYENPTTWDFTVWNAPIMPIYDAQKALNRNGASVFTFKR